MSSDVAVVVNNLSKCYEIYDKPQDRLLQMLSGGRKRHFREFWALQEISFKIQKGETFGIIGRNGSGKSTLLQIIASTLAPTTGEVMVNGRVAALLELGSGFNPEFTGRENIFLNGRILGLKKQDIENRYDEIAAFADIGDFIEQPVKTYSSGMFVRLAFAVQAHIDASVVIIDEALAVGDVFFRQKCYARLEELKSSGAAILLVTHAMQEVEQFCKRSILLDNGRSSFLGDSKEASKRYYLLYQSSPVVGENKQEPEERTTPKHLILTSKLLDSWPDDSIFIDASNLTQVTTGSARCTKFSICNSQGLPQASFSQGETAYFFYEFRALEDLEVPLGGIVLQNERGILVHGKGSLEYGNDTPNFIPKNTLIRCKQSIDLKLEPGDYTFELGLASISQEVYTNRSQFSHEQLFSRIYRVCHLPKAGMFNVRIRHNANGVQLTHHGIADLSGSFEFGFEMKMEDTE
jgi:lipopolysaccharide transport system ATP-binding protein